MVLDIQKIWILFSSLAIYFVHTKNAMGSIHGCEEFLQSTICEDSRHEGSFQDDAPEDDGSQYLNDTGDGNVDHSEEIAICWSPGILYLCMYTNMM